ncbi:NAD(P)H:quinone oxidoreductase, type IV [Phytophthora nicotianae CJ01A1]|uniref:NAD(P)H:quinone oxidoreductase, type IV n=1 Tax=Phytophthora nicotianae CJ01A1 TaxID=1317063 RepID=W2WLZ4_PHYNI|nr:NAD(P)H:quinone oxidoreductase, type IV [Phytophthora nicotianae CJ01A1]
MRPPHYSIHPTPTTSTIFRSPTPTKMTKVAIVFYSTFGHVTKMASAIQKGIQTVPGVQAQLYQVKETLNEEVLAKLHAPPKSDFPIATPDVLKNADGIMLGFPTHFGMVPAQMKALFDASVALWVKGELIGKPCGIFFSCGSRGGGQEVSAMSTTPYIAHLGMLFVPLALNGKTIEGSDEMHGCSLWGSGTVAGHDRSRQPSALELKVAEMQGKKFAEITKKLAA